MYEAFIKNESSEDLEIDAVFYDLGVEDWIDSLLDGKIDGVENGADNGFSLIQLSVKWGRHEFLRKILEGNLSSVSYQTKYMHL